MSRFGKALAIAVALHASLVAQALVTAKAPSISTAGGIGAELSIEIESQHASTTAVASHRAPGEGSGSTRELSSSERIGPPTARLRTAPAATSAASSDPMSEATTGDTLTSGATTGEATAGTELTTSDTTKGSEFTTADATTAASPTKSGAEAKIDLGLDGRMFRLPPPSATANRPQRRELGKELAHKLNASIVADEVERGYARGNVMIAALDTAVRNAGPSSGGAILRVTFDAKGQMSELELLRGSFSDWSSAMKSFREQAKRRQLRVPTGARGLRVTFSVSTKVQRPSGVDAASSKARVERPSLAANGLTLRGEFDVADLSNRTSRMVYSKVIAEEVL